MKAVQFAEYGPAEVLELREVPVPEPGPGQVRVAVRAAGVNPLDWKLREGAMAGSIPITFPSTPGLELAGVVDAVGEGARHAVGDAVFGWSDTGSYAEYALATDVAAKPEALSWRDAVALPVAGETALRCLRLLDVRAGDVLLIHGASGAVGSMATQLAVRSGATVVGTAGPGSQDLVRSLGATALTYGEDLVARVRAVAPRIDAVFDTAGKGALPDSVTLRGGTTDRIVTIADSAAFGMGITFTSGVAGGRDPAVLAELAADVLAGALRLAPGESYPLAEAARAQRQSATGHRPGKITIVVG